MKLAEALLEKKTLTGRINELTRRFSESALVEEGEEPEEDASEILASLKGVFERLQALTVAVNTSNNQIMLGDITMMQALARRDSLKSQIMQYTAIKDQIRGRNQHRMYGGGEKAPKMVISHRDLSAQKFIVLVDTLSQELRLLDASIQAANWANDLVE
jgi:hypothetical protein